LGTIGATADCLAFSGLERRRPPSAKFSSRAKFDGRRQKFVLIKIIGE